MIRKTYFFILCAILISDGCVNPQSQSRSIEGSFFNIDTVSSGNLPQTIRPHEWSGKAWRGERISTQLQIWATETKKEVHISTSALSGSKKTMIPANHIKLYRIVDVLTDEFAEGCEKTGIEHYDSSLVADVLEPVKNTMELNPGAPLLFWVSIDIPSDAHSGIYTGEITLEDGGNKRLDFQFEVEVLAPELPAPSDWKFHLDLWQNPFSVARYYNVEPWSKEHFKWMKPTMEMLAQAGQKCITATISHKPWAGQTFDAFESMVKKTKEKNGSWSYDYSAFDAWVEFSMECGIGQQINCYSMVSWSNEYSYFDESKGQEISVSCKPGSSAYDHIWVPFLNDFNKHLQLKNWHEKTTISMDERSLEDLLKVIDLVKREAPGLKISFAGRYHPELEEELFDMSVASAHIVPLENIARREAKGFKTTFYVCCVEEQPNTFTFSNPAEASYLAWYAANRNFDGMLRWSYNSWTEDPLRDSRFRRFPGGDTYMVYPGGLSSVRFERLREGIQDFEKIMLIKEGLRAEDSKASLDKLNLLNLHLAKFDIQSLPSTPASELVAEGKQLLNQLSE